jgi:hypothetical protein
VATVKRKRGREMPGGKNNTRRERLGCDPCLTFYIPVEAMSEQNPLHPCTAEKPELYETVQLYFDGEKKEDTGRWTGRFWWSHGHEVAPLCWQYFEPHFTGAPGVARGLRH